MCTEVKRTFPSEEIIRSEEIDYKNGHSRISFSVHVWTKDERDAKRGIPKGFGHL